MASSKTKLLVINSFGPMASTLLSGLMEKAGFTNVPLRKIGLHQYLTGQKPLDCGYVQTRLKTILNEHSSFGQRGGVSVIDRDSSAPQALCDIAKVSDHIDLIKGSSVQNLYSQVHKAYYDAVIYKEIRSNRDWHIEMTTDIHRYNHTELYAAYQEHFDDVKMIHLHRSFEGWINSLASQAFVHPEFKHRVKFFPHLRYADYKLYEDAVTAMPGLHIQFDEMFDTSIEKIFSNICAYIGVPTPACNLRSEDFDMYGKSVPYDKAFKRFDDNIRFLSDDTKAYLHKLAESGKIRIMPYSGFAWLRYLKDMRAYRKTR